MRKVTISRLKPEKIDQYVEMHRNVPIEVCEIMAAHHHRNHSVYLYGDKLFQYFDYTGTDFEADINRCVKCLSCRHGGQNAGTAFSHLMRLHPKHGSHRRRSFIMPEGAAPISSTNGGRI